MGLLEDFSQFLEEYGVIGLAVAFVIGLAVKDLVSATVEGIIMPVIEIFLPEGEWQAAVWELAGIEFQVGLFLNALIDFLIIALLIFLFVKYVMSKKEVEKL